MIGDMKNSDISFIHSMLDDYIEYFWFNRKPSVEITVDVGKISSFLKKIHMESELLINESDDDSFGRAVRDPVLSHYLNVNFYYFYSSDIYSLSRLIRKQCKMEIPEKDCFMKIHIDKGTYVIAEKVGSMPVSSPLRQSWGHQKKYNTFLKSKHIDFNIYAMFHFLSLLYIDFGERFKIPNLAL
ncbi:MAG: hypothetical protein FWC91_02965 [Defluviitaleaceae bacterium]|nr:hypothetical protein [Defluviitaleaceae bacterium]